MAFLMLMRKAADEDSFKGLVFYEKVGYHFAPSILRVVKIKGVTNGSYSRD